MYSYAQRGRDGRASSSTRRRVRRSVPPTAEGLEVRQMLTAGPLGINLGSLDYVDMIRGSQGWAPATGSTLTTDANGWPTQDAAVLAVDARVNQPWNGPDPNAVSPDIGGTYTLSFHGQATIAPPNWLQIFTVQNQSYDAQTNVTTAQVVVGHNVLPFLQLYFTNTVNRESATGAGVSQVQLLQPGYSLGTTQEFTTDFLNALKPFGALRYLNLDAANQYGPQTSTDAPLDWSHRTLPSFASQTNNSQGTLGVSWEDMIALANATNTDMWINVPGPATNDYVLQLANLIKNGDTVGGVTYAGLNPNLKVYVEYSNEVWGGVYNPYGYNQEAAKAEVAAGGSALNNDGSTDAGIWGQRRYLERTMQVGDIFRGVFGADPTYSKIRPVLGWQENNWQYYTGNFPWFESTFGAVSRSFYGMGNAIYWGPSDTSSVDAIINTMAAAEPANISSMQQFTAIASYYGLKNVSYEGGPALGGGTATAQANALAASRDPRMEALVRQHYLNYFAAGGDLTMYFDGPYEIWSPQYGIWGSAELSQKANPSLSPKYHGLADLAAAPTQPVTGGIPVSTTGPTSLPVNFDLLGQSVASPRTGENNYWLVNVPAAGTYDLSLTTAVNGDWANHFEPAQVQVQLANKQVVGTYGVEQGSVNSLGAVTLNTGLNVLVIHTIHGQWDPSFPSFNNHFMYQPTSLTLLPAIQATGVGGTGYTETGPWTPNGTYDVAAPGSGTSSASWTFNVTPGLFRISADWAALANGSPDASFTIFDGANQLGTVTVNQKSAPSGFSDGTTTWQDLGGPYTVLGGNITVRLNSATDGSVSAQSVRIQQTQGIGSSIDDNISDYNFATTGTWTSYGSGSFLPSTSWAVTPAGAGTATATWTIVVTPGLYKVSANWTGGSGFSAAAPYTVFDGANQLGAVKVNQQVASAGYNDGSTGWQDLGGPYTITGNLLTVHLTNVPDGNVEAMAIRVQQLPTSGATPPPPPTPQVIDNGTIGFNATPAGAWGTVNGIGYGGSIAMAGAGDGSQKADWSFSNLASGSYLVSVTWAANPAFATNAPFTVSDGTKTVGAVAVNETLTPAGSADPANGPWLDLGIFTVSSGLLKVELTNLAKSYVMADAVRIEPVASAPPPATQVVDNGTLNFNATPAGAWATVNGLGYGGSIAMAGAGDGSQKADWSFSNLAAGSYLVSVTWAANPAFATNAPFTVSDGTRALGTVAVNEKLTPAGSADQANGPWLDLGTFTVSSGSMQVELSNLANSYVMADAVRIKRVATSAAVPATATSTATSSSAFALAASVAPPSAAAPTVALTGPPAALPIALSQGRYRPRFPVQAGGAGVPNGRVIADSVRGLKQS